MRINCYALRDFLDGGEVVIMIGFKHVHDKLCPDCGCETLFYHPHASDRFKDKYLCLFCQHWVKKSRVE